MDWFFVFVTHPHADWKAETCDNTGRGCSKKRRRQKEYVEVERGGWKNSLGPQLPLDGGMRNIRRHRMELRMLTCEDQFRSGLPRAALRFAPLSHSADGETPRSRSLRWRPRSSKEASTLIARRDTTVWSFLFGAWVGGALSDHLHETAEMAG